MLSESLPPPSVRRVPRWVVGLFFGVLLALGLGVHADYGVSWDEPVNRQNGLVSLRYVAELVAPGWTARQPRLLNAPLLSSYPDRDYGVLFDLPLAVADVLRPGTDDADYYRLRHLLTYLACLSAPWALFRLAVRRFRDERLGLLTAGLLVLSPRLFAESFYNAKDVLFLAVFTVGMYTLVRLLEHPCWQRAAGHALVTAAAIDVRILGVLLLPFTLTMVGLTVRFQPGGRSVAAAGRLLGTYLLLTAGATVAAWPYLWSAPFDHLVQAFTNMSHFRWSGKMLYWGESISEQQLPWHYLPVWLIITTPVAYVVAALGGLLGLSGELLRRPLEVLRRPKGRLDVLFAGWLVLPFLLIIGLHSVVYDGWRHLYFVYPALLLLAVRGGQQLWEAGQHRRQWRLWALAGMAVAALELVGTAVRMVRMHPHQQTYFSFLPARQVERLFERDYWALSYRQGLEYVVARQPTGRIPIDVSHVPPLENNKVWLAPADRARLLYMPTAAGRYFITAYRRTPGSYPDTVGQEVFSIRADGVKILSVFRRASGRPLPQAVPGNQGK